MFSIMLVFFSTSQSGTIFKTHFTFNLHCLMIGLGTIAILKHLCNGSPLCFFGTMYWQGKVHIQSFKRLLKNTAVTKNCDLMLSFRSFVCSYPRCTYVCCRGRSEVRPGGSMVDVGETYNGPTTSSEHRSLDDLHPTIPGSTQMFICDVLAALRYLCNA